MVGSAKVTQAFRKLVALVARAFYAGEYPPKTLEEIAATSPTRAKQQGPIYGLVILLLDALCGKDKDDRPVEWIKEEILAESLHLHIKLVRKTLRFLEQEQLLAREHRSESVRIKKKQAAVQAAAGRGEPVETVAEELKADVTSYCCIDYPSLMNVVLLRLYKMRRSLQDQASDRHTIQKYLCQRCQRTYTALDVATFPMKDLAFQCEHCSEEGYDVPLRESYQGQDGDLVDAQQRAQRVSQAKQMQKALEEQLKPLTEHLGKLRGVPVPDFGPFDEWSNNKNALEAHRKRRAAGVGGGSGQRREGELDGIDLDFDDTQVEVQLEGANGGASEEASGPAAQKALPPWMLRQGITSTSSASGGQPLGAPFTQANGPGVGSSNDAIASEKDQKEIEEAYLKQYMAQVELIQQRSAAARAGTLDAQQYQDLEDLKTELAIAQAEVDAEDNAAPVKRVKVDGGWSDAPGSMPALAVKADDGFQGQGTLSDLPQQPGVSAPVDGADADANGWEDIKVKVAHPEVKPELQSDQQAALADEDDWEDV
ncbi:hypothetical protein WJX79_001186 [Trebouxia sp. C0005]